MGPRSTEPSDVTALISLGDHYEEIFESAPCALLVVDQDLRIHDFNRFAFTLLREHPDPVRAVLGDALQCENALSSPGGCGTSKHCPDCRLRNAVIDSMRSGDIRRSIVDLRIVTESGVIPETLMVASAVAHRAADASDHDRLVLTIHRLSDWDEAFDQSILR